MIQNKFTEYIESTRYWDDLHEVRNLWSHKDIARLSGIYIYLNQFVVGDCMELEFKYSERFKSQEGMLRDLEVTKIFTYMITGLPMDSDNDGLKEARTRKFLSHLNEKHHSFDIQDWMMEHMANTIAISPVIFSDHDELKNIDMDRYNHYMDHLWRVMGITRFLQTDMEHVLSSKLRAIPELGSCISYLFGAYQFIYGQEETRSLFKQVIAKLDYRVLATINPYLNFL